MTNALAPTVASEVIGLIPAGGQATRISPLPASKELYPIGFRHLESGQVRPKVVAHYLLDNLRLAGITKTYFVLRPGKWDIPAYFGGGAMCEMSLGYLVAQLPYGVPYTLDQAYPFVKHAIVAFGFPDILFQPQDKFVHLLARQAATGADVVIGAVPFADSRKGGMIDFDAAGRVHHLVEKPPESELRHSWCSAVWTPAFTEFMHQFLADVEEKRQIAPDDPVFQREIPLGDVIQAAIHSGLHVEAEVFPHGQFLDIGTPGDLICAVRNFSTEALEKLSTQQGEL